MNRRRAARALHAIGAVKLILIAAVVTAAAAGTLLAWRAMRPVVTVTEVVEGPAVEAFYATGVLSPEREYLIRTSREGVLVEVLVDKGDAVEAGQALARVEDEEVRLQREQAAAEVREKRERADAKASPVLREYDAKIDYTGQMLVTARGEERRLAPLAETGAASQTDLDRARDRVNELTRELRSMEAQRDAKLLELRKDLEVAEAALAIAEWSLGQLTLRSPVDGQVLDRPAPQGTRLAVNDQVMRVADVSPDKLVMRAQVDEEDVTLVSVDPPQEVHMSLYSFADVVFAGRVRRVYPQADPDRRTFEVDADLPRPADEGSSDTRPADPKREKQAEDLRKYRAKFRAGMSGELTFIIQSKDQARVVPSQALQDGKLYVVRDGRLRVAEAQIGLKGVERVEVVSGLEPGDRVVISPAARLRDGQSVRAQFMDPREAAALNKPKEKQLFRGGF
jgi:multidrug efflux pump subunit AcrA (membrane-fusion protein)